MLENWTTGSKFDHMFIKNKNLNFVCSYTWNGELHMLLFYFNCFIYVLPQAVYLTSLIHVWIAVDNALTSYSHLSMTMFFIVYFFSFVL